MKKLILIFLAVTAVSVIGFQGYKTGQSAPFICASASSSSTTYTCPSTTKVTTPYTGMQVRWIPDVLSGAAPTLNMSGGAKNIKTLNNTTPAVGFYAAGIPVNLWYDGTSFRSETPTNATIRTNLADPSHVLAYYRFHDVTSCANGASVIDSSGNGNHATVVSDGGLTCAGPGIENFEASTNYLTIPTGLTGSVKSMEIIYDPMRIGSLGGIQTTLNSSQPLLATPTIPSASPSFSLGSFLLSSDSIWTFFPSVMLNHTTTGGHAFVTFPPGPNHAAWTLSGSAWMNGMPIHSYISDSSGTAQNGTYRIGSNGIYQAAGRMISMVIRDNTPSTLTINLDKKIMEDAAQAAGAMNPRIPDLPDYTLYNVTVILGDSICDGSPTHLVWFQYTGGMVNHSAPDYGTINSVGPYGFANVGTCTSGAPLGKAGEIKSVIKPFKPVYGTGFVIEAGGSNNLVGGQVFADGVNLFDNEIPPILSTIRTEGFIPIMATLLDRDVTREPMRFGYNSRIRQQCGIFDKESGIVPYCLLLDFAADANLGFDGKTGDTTWFVDTIHPTALGFQAMSVLYANLINMHFGTTKSNPSTTLTTGTTAQAYGDLYVPLNPAGAATATSTLPDATGITNSVRRVICLSTAAGTCTVNTTSAQTIISATGSVTTLNITAGTVAVFMADYGSTIHPVNAAPGWIRLPDNH